MEETNNINEDPKERKYKEEKEKYVDTWDHEYMDEQYKLSEEELREIIKCNRINDWFRFSTCK